MASPAEMISSKAALAGAKPQLFFADIKAACDFFANKLGFSVVFIEGEPPFYAQVTRDGARIHLRCVDNPVIEPGRKNRECLLSASMIVGTVAKIRQLFREFEPKGVAFQQALNL